ncbi:helix-turn-helix domain-containing protein [Eggerthia catenaformis]
MNNNYENFGQRIKQLRLDKGFTQQEVATELGVTPGYISNVENNRTAMSIQTMVLFAKMIDITLDYLVGIADSKYTDTAVNHELNIELSKLSKKDKEKLLKTIKIWTEQ